MSANLTRGLALLALIGGEIIIAYTLSLAAKASEGGGATLQSLSRFGLPIGMGAAVLLLGYLLGIRSFKSIWVVSVISTSSVLVCEPVFAYVVFARCRKRVRWWAWRWASWGRWRRFGSDVCYALSLRPECGLRRCE